MDSRYYAVCYRIGKTTIFYIHTGMAEQARGNAAHLASVTSHSLLVGNVLLAILLQIFVNANR